MEVVHSTEFFLWDNRKEPESMHSSALQNAGETIEFMVTGSAIFVLFRKNPNIFRNRQQIGIEIATKNGVI